MMFKVGDRVRVKNTGYNQSVRYEEKSEGVVVKADWDIDDVYYKGKICRVLYDKEVMGGLEWWTDNDALELITTTKPKRKKKEPIPEGWE